MEEVLYRNEFRIKTGWREYCIGMNSESKRNMFKESHLGASWAYAEV
jgi:hypothetical protein